MKKSGLRRIGVVVAICAVVGALAGIAGSAAAPSKSSKSSSATQAQKNAAKARAKARALRRGLRLGLPGPGFWGGPVHAEAVVPNSDGTGFVTVTTDAGTLKSVDGTTVHIKEGTDKATYKDDVAIDVGSDATVIRNHKKASLSDLKEGDHVRVIKGPKRTVVFAEDDAWIAQEKKEHERFGFGFRHHGGPPPGAPAMPAYPGDDPSGGTNS